MGCGFSDFLVFVHGSWDFHSRIPMFSGFCSYTYIIHAVRLKNLLLNNAESLWGQKYNQLMKTEDYCSEVQFQALVFLLLLNFADFGLGLQVVVSPKAPLSFKIHTKSLIVDRSLFSPFSLSDDADEDNGAKMKVNSL